MGAALSRARKIQCLVIVSETKQPNVEDLMFGCRAF